MFMHTTNIQSNDVPQTVRLDTSRETSYAQTVIWKYGNMEIRKYGNTEIHNYGVMVILRVIDPSAFISS